MPICLNPKCKNEAVAEFGEYCSQECKKDHYYMKMKEQWTTISIKVGVRDRIILIQNDILKKVHKKIGYSEIIDGILNILEEIYQNVDEGMKVTIGDILIDNLDLVEV